MAPATDGFKVDDHRGAGAHINSRADRLGKFYAVLILNRAFCRDGLLLRGRVKPPGKKVLLNKYKNGIN